MKLNKVAKISFLFYRKMKTVKGSFILLMVYKFKQKLSISEFNNCRSTFLLLHSAQPLRLMYMTHHK